MMAQVLHGSATATGAMRIPISKTKPVGFADGDAKQMMKNFWGTA
jgi:hypothetical protein